MLKPSIIIKTLVLLSTAESYVLVEESCCTKDSDCRGGVCRAPEDCPRLERRGSASRRRSRRFSCLSQKMVCCRSGRRASTFRLAYERRAATHNERCTAGASGRAPDPSAGCCGREADVTNRIVGGGVTGLAQYPWMALLEYSDAEGQRLPDLLCGGSLVSQRYVLTAKHCVAGIGTARASRVRLAEYDQRTSEDCVTTEGGGLDCVNSTVIDVEEVVTSLDHDIALIRLKKPAPYTDFIRPLCLPTEDVTKTPAPPGGLRFVVAGWGITKNRRRSHVKRAVGVPHMPIKLCAKIFETSKKMKPEQEPICAGGVAGEDSCGGDSGGPLMHDAGGFVQAAGVVSFGPSRCGTGGIPAIHVNVHRNRAWIVDNMRD